MTKRLILLAVLVVTLVLPIGADAKKNGDWGCPAAAANPATIWGTDGHDTIYGTAGNDVISTGPGNDRVYGLGGHDHLCGGGGNDWIYGGEGNDTLAGEYGVDHLDGGNGLDTCGVAAGNGRRDNGVNHFKNCERLVGDGRNN